LDEQKEKVFSFFFYLKENFFVFMDSLEVALLSRHRCATALFAQIMTLSLAFSW